MTPTKLTDLRCEFATNPLGIDVQRPRFSWKLETDRLGAEQKAYQVKVGTLIGDHDLWDSGRIDSSESVLVEHMGLPLASQQRAYWTVTIWDETGDEITSESAWWESGLTSPNDWVANWIQSSLAGGPRSTIPVPYLRREFKVKKPIAKARLYVSALGVYEVRLNGEKIGEAELAPGWTDYRHRVRYQTYDVTNRIHSDINCLAALLGDGWYCGYLGWKDRQTYGDRPQFIAQLVITHEDGTTEKLCSDSSWKFAFGSILESDMLMGESQDLRREPTNWDQPGYNETGWLPVEVTDPKTTLVAQFGPLVKAIEEIAPKLIVERPNWPTSRQIVDFGQNMVGRVRLKVRGERGTTIVLRFAERLNPDGSLYVTNYRGAKSIDSFTLAGGGEEILEPKFTFHGFQYVEISGISSLDPEDIRGIVLHSAWEPQGEFECSNPLINQLQHNIQWGWKGNSLDVPTDCPQRDERLGWTGDAQVFVRTACFNGNVASFFEKYQQDLEDSQSPEGQIPPVAPFMDITGADGGPAWSDAFLICPWTIYRYFGDERILSKYYSSMKRWVDSLQLSSRDLIRSYHGFTGFNGFGDWLSTNADTPIDLIGTAFSAYCSFLLSQIATILGQEEDANHYKALGEAVKKAFQHRFVTGDGIVAPGTQTAYVLALHFDLVPDHLRSKVVQYLVNDIERKGWKLSTGFVGTPYLNHVLTEGGRIDVAYKLLLQQEWPSWLYSVTQGATTIWERWDGWTHDKGFQDPGMNSFNHYAYGAIGDWLYSIVAGIQVDPKVAGYKKIILFPRPGGGLSYARGSLQTPYGQLTSHWQLTSSEFRWHIVIPPNTSAEIKLPPNITVTSIFPETRADNKNFLAPGTYDLVGEVETNL